MPRGRKPRTWVKMDCEGLLRGSINYLLDLDGQAVWLKMIALSEVCGGRPGFIEDNNKNGLPREYIAHELHCSIELLNQVIEKMEGDEAIHINGTGSIELVNFRHYQFSEYDRQQQYQNTYRKEKSGKPVNKICRKCGFKLTTTETTCPECGGELARDYKGGKFEHVVRQ